MLLGFHCSAVIKEAGAVSQAVKKREAVRVGGVVVAGVKIVYLTNFKSC